jgi:hypothetical protein
MFNNIRNQGYVYPKHYSGQANQVHQMNYGEREYDLNNLKDVNEIFAQIALASQAHRPRNFRRR